MRIDRWLYTVPLRLRALFRSRQLDAELDEEIAYHVERQTELNIASGMTPRLAREAALRRFGGVVQRKEECRDRRRLSLLHDLVQDVRYGIRVLRRAPRFTTTAVLALALGIGANTAIFHLVDALRLRPLPVKAPADLAILQAPNRVGASGSFDSRYPDFTYPVWEQLRLRQRAFSQLLAWSHSTFDLAPHGESRFAENGLWVSGNFFEMLGISPQLGRLFTDADDVRGCTSPGVVASDRFWRRELGADRRAVGRPISVNGHRFELIGVTPPDFYGVEVGRAYDIALPMCAEALLNGEASKLSRSWGYWVAVMGRLAPGWSLEQASAHVDALSPALFRDTLPSGYSPGSAKSYLGFRLAALDGRYGYSRLRQQYDVPLRLLFGVAGLVLLITCANVANLMLARMTGREREIAARLALGASRGRLVRQLLTESLLITVVGTACGAWLAPLLGRAAVEIISSQVDPMFVDLGADWRVLAFTIGLAALTCISFGTAPALRSTRVAPGESMKTGGRSTAGRTRSALRRGLVVAQIAFSLALVATGLLLARTLVNLLTADAGFRQAGVLEADIDLSHVPLSPGDRQRFHRTLLDTVRHTAGVAHAATAMSIPIVGDWSQTVYFDSRVAVRTAIPNFNGVSPDYFLTLGIPLLAGRDFGERDTPSTPLVAIVNHVFAQRFYGFASPLGRTFQVDGPSGGPERTYEIVGVVGDTKQSDLREAFGPIVYLAAWQNPAPGTFAQILSYTPRSTAATKSQISQALAALHPDLAFHFHDFREQVRYSIQMERLMATFSGVFAAVAALLAIVGVYGLVSYSAMQRTNEVGIRLALGADRREIVRLFLRETLSLLAVGIVVGGLLALVAGRLTASLLFGVLPHDPATLACAILALAGPAVIATLLPARRVSRCDPVAALRRE